MLGGRVLSPPTHEALRDLDVHRSMPSMDWYRAARAKYRGEISWETMIAAEDRVRELDAELRVPGEWSRPTTDATMDWYRAARAKYRGEISWETMIAAEDRVRELDAELNRAMEGQRHDVKRSNV